MAKKGKKEPTTPGVEGKKRRGKEGKKRKEGEGGEELLKLWRDPSFPGAFSGLDAFYRGLQQRGLTKGRTKKEVRQILEQDLHYQVSRGLRKHFPVRKDLVFGWNGRSVCISVTWVKQNKKQKKNPLTGTRQTWATWETDSEI